MTARLGYSFYPGMMVEFSYTHQPKYRAHYKLPKQDTPVIPGTAFPVTDGKTHFRTNVYMLNLFYEFSPVKTVHPFIMLGAGFADVHIKPSEAKSKHPFFGETVIFKTKRNKIKCPAWQVGVGLSKPITENFSMDISAKFQVIKNIKIRYEKLVGPNAFKEEKPIKTDVAMGEFSVGFIFKFPVK